MNKYGNQLIGKSNVTILQDTLQELSVKNEQKDKRLMEQQKVNADLQKQIDELKAALMNLMAQKSPCTTSK